MKNRFVRSLTTVLALLAVCFLVPAASLEAGVADPGTGEESFRIHRAAQGFEAGFLTFLERVWSLLGGVVPLSGAGMDPNG